MKTKPVLISFRESFLKDIDAAATSTQLTRNGFIRQACIEKIKAMEKA